MQQISIASHFLTYALSVTNFDVAHYVLTEYVNVMGVTGSSELYLKKKNLKKLYSQFNLFEFSKMA